METTQVPSEAKRSRHHLPPVARRTHLAARGPPTPSKTLGACCRTRNTSSSAESAPSHDQSGRANFAITVVEGGRKRAHYVNNAMAHCRIWRAMACYGVLLRAIACYCALPLRAIAESCGTRALMRCQRSICIANDRSTSHGYMGKRRASGDRCRACCACNLAARRNESVSAPSPQLFWLPMNLASRVPSNLLLCAPTVLAWCARP